MNENELVNEYAKRYNKSQQDLNSVPKLLKEMENLNEKLLRAEKMKSEFLSNIRNEIVNPLSSIIGLSALMMSPGSDKKNMEQHANMVHDEAFKLNFQLQNIFMAAELEAGKVALNVSMVDIGTLLSELILDFNGIAERKHVEVILDGDIAGNALYNDSDKLYIIFSNLLANAIEFSPLGAEVNILVDGSRVSFKDIGVGISKEDQKVIFDRFVQLESGPTKSHSGHGLGLAISKDLADMLGAIITIESQKGKGSTFTINLKEVNPEQVKNITNGEEFLFTNDDGGEIF